MKVEVKNLQAWDNLRPMVAKRFQSREDSFWLTFGEEDRTGEQNKLIHAIFKQCADKGLAKDKDGNPCKRDKEYWKEILKEKLGKKIVEFNLEDEPNVITVSTSKYTKSEISDFVVKIQAYMATKGVQIILEGEE